MGRFFLCHGLPTETGHERGRTTFVFCIWQGKDGYQGAQVSSLGNISFCGVKCRWKKNSMQSSGMVETFSSLQKAFHRNCSVCFGSRSANCHRSLGWTHSLAVTWISGLVNVTVTSDPYHPWGLGYLPTFTIKNQLNVGKYTMTMDPMGEEFKFRSFWRSW